MCFLDITLSLGYVGNIKGQTFFALFSSNESKDEIVLINKSLKSGWRNNLFFPGLEIRDPSKAIPTKLIYILTILMLLLGYKHLKVAFVNVLFASLCVIQQYFVIIAKMINLYHLKSTRHLYLANNKA